MDGRTRGSIDFVLETGAPFGTRREENERRCGQNSFPLFPRRATASSPEEYEADVRSLAKETRRAGARLAGTKFVLPCRVASVRPRGTKKRLLQFRMPCLFDSLTGRCLTRNATNNGAPSSAASFAIYVFFARRERRTVK